MTFRAWRSRGHVRARPAIRGAVHACGLALALACGACSNGSTSADASGRDDGSVTSGDAGESDASDTDASAGEPCARMDEAAPFVDERALHPVALEPHAFFRIEVVEAGSEAPLAGAVLTTVNHIALVADVNGVIAFYEPGLMDRDVYFDVAFPGYTRAGDGFGYTGVRLQTTEGGSAQVEMQPMASATPPVVTSDLQTRLAAGPVPGPDECFAIEVVDDATGRGVPLVRVAIDGGDAYWTDSNGLVAFCDPDRVDAVLDLQLNSHGYAPASLDAQASAGGAIEIELTRQNVAERLYRITGQGIYRDSVLLGRDVPLEQPVLNGEVLGQDTVQTALYRGQVFWVWGDTNRASYPLGNFHTSSALSELDGIPPSAGVDLSYYVGDDGFSKPMAPTSTVPGDGVTWLGSMIAVPNASGDEQLFAAYALVPDVLTADEIGLVRFDDVQELFVKALQLPSVDSRGPTGHPTRWLEASGDYVYYQPPLRIPATAEAMVDPDTYETFTALSAGSDDTLERDADGSLHYTWKTGTDYTTRELLDAQSIASDQALEGFITDPKSGATIEAHGATSRTWNAHRARFVEMVQQVGGSSFLGEVWYAEGDTPMGPWVYARKIVSHDGYTFYNPRQHPFFDQQAGRRIYLEGTYVTTFAGGNPEPTPRYDYNQVMYRLDVDDPRVVLPVAVYDDALAVDATGSTTRLARSLATKGELSPSAQPVRAIFFAPDRALPGYVVISWSGPSCRARRLIATPPGVQPPTPPLFYALPASTKEGERPETAVALFEHENASGEHAYAAGELDVDGFTRASAPLGYVWRSPIAVRLPVADYLGELVAYAGDDQCVTGAGETTEIALDARGSRSLRGEIVRARWSVQTTLGCASAEGTNATLELPQGVHAITLEIWNEHGVRDTDTLLVEIAR